LVSYNLVGFGYTQESNVLAQIFTDGLGIFLGCRISRRGKSNHQNLDKVANLPGIENYEPQQVGKQL
jgi:hypothetical protein